MLLCYSRRYGEAVQELSICMAFATVEEAEILESFVEKLHLMRAVFLDIYEDIQYIQFLAVGLSFSVQLILSLFWRFCI
uniref:Uncharacterized protein n=1 Tax=Picea sitchensis TaxID=3332 RepID=B8LML4_PICSI|nr:unknown [Picea sitchensis]